MEVLRRIDEVRQLRDEWRHGRQRVGVVLTMGALHNGHLALVDRARSQTDKVLATVFVNPIQFTHGEDFSTYPRQEEQDLCLLEERGCDAVFAPDVDEIFPGGRSELASFPTHVRVTGLTERLCGLVRPSHFEGVTTEVTKHFMITEPDVTYFGEKDYQQLQVIRRMVADLNMRIVVEGVPTVREDDGLALSSRNAYLSEAQRATAPALYRILCASADAIVGSPATLASSLETGRRLVADAGFAPVDYLELIDASTLEPLLVLDRPARLVGSGWLGATRLTDNVPVEPPSAELAADRHC